MGITSKQPGQHLFPSGLDFRVVRYPAASALAVQSHVAVLTSPVSVTYTLAAAVRDGLAPHIINGTEQTQVVQFPAEVLWDGTAGGTKNRITFNAYLGASAELVGFASGLWAVTSTGRDRRQELSPAWRWRRTA